MQKTLVLMVLAILLCVSSALAIPPTDTTDTTDARDATDGEAVGHDSGESSALKVTRTAALWIHGVTGAASLVGSAVYGIRGLRGSELSEYKDDCESGVAGACSRYEATERERRVDQELGQAFILYSVGSLAGWAFAKSTDPTRLDPNNRGAASALFGTSAALSAATAGMLMYTLKLRSDFSDAADACFGGDCNEIGDAASDVSSSLAVPLIVTGLNYVLSVSTTIWLQLAERHQVSLAPTFHPNHTGATLTGRF
ncbi:MAG TPA: hypothetical protein VFU02_22340 [Polyangiaceae bacterium]|nr:hypothetical protein [Polyangiaceae bacterium]